MDVLRTGGAVPLGDVYAFVSSLYYRGKRAYATAFAKGASVLGPLVVTPTRGVVADETPVTLSDLESLAAGDIDERNEAYREALIRTARELDRRMGSAGRVVFLGSIASDKYVGPLGQVFGPRLAFPAAFVGRGDMSRGGLLLRSVAAGSELEYVPALSARRRGERLPKLGPRGP